MVKVTYNKVTALLVTAAMLAIGLFVFSSTPYRQTMTIPDRP
jgi:hypothetical protein